VNAQFFRRQLGFWGSTKLIMKLVPPQNISDTSLSLRFGKTAQLKTNRHIRWLLLLLGLALTAVPAAAQCTDGYQIHYSPYVVQNNQWNKNKAAAGYWQCVWAHKWGDIMNWGASFDWKQANPYEVKAYPSIVRGWNFDNTPGLGIRVGDTVKTVKSNWTWKVRSGTPKCNASYDIWIHNKSKPTASDFPKVELMIWPYASDGFLPYGPKVVSGAFVSGHYWDIYAGDITSFGKTWKIVTYRRTSNTMSLTNLSLTAIWKEAAWRGFYTWDDYVSSIMAGWEVVTGLGDFETTSYTVSGT
jgi:hypothetical protein